VNLRCTYCQNMFALSRTEMLAALQTMDTENLHHYDAYCPRCRRANSIARDRLEWANPGWREAVKVMLKEAARAEKAAAPAKAEKPTAPKAAAVKPVPKPKPAPAKAAPKTGSKAAVPKSKAAPKAAKRPAAARPK